MTRRTTLALAAFAIALFVTACGGEGGITAVSDEERQEREDTIDRESDAGAGLGNENSSDAQEDTLERELDGDARRAEADSDDTPEVIYVGSVDTSIEVLARPCFSDEGFVRTSDRRVGCTSAAGLAGIVSCDEGFRPTLDFAMPADSDSLFTSTCASLDDAPDDVFDSLEMDDG